MSTNDMGGKHVTAESREILDYLVAQRDEKKSKRFHIERCSPREYFPLSRSQQRMWLLEQIEPGNPALTLTLPLQLPGEINRSALERCLCEIARRHEVLRTTLDLCEGEPVQIVHPELPLDLRRTDLMHLDAEEAADKARACIKELWGEPFDLVKGPLLRYQLLDLSASQRWLIVSMHHIVTDRISIAILISEISELYAAYLRDRPSPLADPVIQYRDYAVWERETLTDEILEPHLDYWRRQLTELPILSLPNDYPRPPLQTFSGASEKMELSASLGAGLQDLVKIHRVTPFMVLISAFFILLHRYSGQSDIIVGTPTANRNLPELERLIGFFLTTLVLRVDLTACPSFGEVLERVRKTTLDAHSHQDVSFERLIEDLQPVRDLSRSPLFQVFFAHLNKLGNASAAPQVTDDRNEDVVISSLHGLGATQFDLEMYVADADTGFKVSIVYNPDLFAASTIRQFLGHYGRVLEAMVSDPTKPVSDIALLSPSERHQLLVEWNDSDRAYPRDKCAHHLFEEQVSRTPEATAIGFEGQSLTYSELDSRANQIARALQSHDCKPGERIGICMERSLELVVAMLGVFKSGGAYVPLDPSFPGERLSFMMRDSGISILLTQGRVSAPPPGPECTVIDVEAQEQALLALDCDALNVDLGPEDLAYVIYTSGSSGQPKGVCIEHHALVNFICAMQTAPGIEADDVLLSVTTPSFDIFGLELYLPLSTGARVQIAVPETSMDADALAQALNHYAVTVMQATPATWQMLISSGWNGRRGLKALCGGEALSPQLASQLRERVASTWNMYGPTETTIWSTVERVCDQTVAGAVSIGRPIANTRVYILDGAMQPVPVGVSGELYIGGDGLARGYHGRAELTEERFLQDPFSENPGARVYRTGDLARYRRDGRIEYLGRGDDQVKLRGYRIELGEIESALDRAPGVRESRVLARQGSDNDQLLVGYVRPVEGQELDAGRVREFLRSELPEYMVPQAYVEVASWPLSPSGKLDRRGLPMPPRERQVAAEYASPRNELERRLAAIWAESLGLERVGVHDRFFDLGGHSLNAVQVVSKIREALGPELAQKDIKMVALFRYPTIDSLARYLGGDTDTDRQVQVIARARVERRNKRIQKSDDIAIVSMAGRYPGAPDLDSYWRNLAAGEESIRFFDEQELRAANIPDALISNPRYVPARGAIDGVELFDAGFFGYSPRETELLDPQQRLFLECAWESMDLAGCDPTRFDGLVGVYAGAATNQYLFQLLTRPDVIGMAGGAQALIGSDNDFMPMRVSYKLNLRGPSINVQTTCSTSLVAVHEACRSLADFQCDLALAGGVSIVASRVGGYVYQEQSIFSPDGHCRPFDAKGAGTVFGEGVGVVVLKRLSEALADGDPIRAVIRGTAVNNDGSDKVGFTAPSVSAQAELVAQAHAAAGVEASSIGYVEAHGTGTSLGDPIEVSALHQAFEGAPRGSCALGAVKSNIGHLDRAAGIAGLMKTVLMLEHGEIPPSLHYEEANPEIDFEAGPFYVNTQLKPWERVDGQPRRAGVSSFGMGGTNAHVVLEEAPELAASDASRRWQVLVVSAKNEAALAEACANLADHLEQHPDEALADVAYTLQVGRTGFERRVAVVSDDLSGAIEALRKPDAVRSAGEVRDGRAPEVVFLYPGQGTQYPNMGRELYEVEAVYREAVDECCERLAEALGLDLRTLLYPQVGDEEAAGEALKRTSLTQPALFVTEYALTQLLAEWGIRPVAMVGHSIGELVAACVSGVLDRDAALRLVTERGRLMEEAPSGVMVSVLASAEQARVYEGEGIWLSVVNGPQASVLSCTHEASTELEARLEADGLAYQRLQTSHAFHCGLMDNVLGPLDAVSEGLSLAKPQVAYVSNVTGDWVDGELDAGYWSRQVRAAVRFDAGVETVLARHPDAVLLEVGPGQALSQLVRGVSKDKVAAVVRTQAGAKDKGTAGEWLARGLGELWCAGVAVDWAKTVGAERRLKVALPTYPFQRKRYWVEPGKRGAEAPQRGVHKQSDISKWFYAPTWKPSIVPALEPVEKRPRRWLVLVDVGGLGGSLAERLEASGTEVIRVLVGEGFECRDEGQYVVSPTSAADLDALFDDLAARQRLPDVVLHAFGLDDAPDGVDADPSMVDEGFFSVLYLVQALASRAADRPWRLELMTRGVLDAPGCNPIPARSAVAGLCRVIPQEMAGVACRLVDAGDDNRDGGLVDDLLSELLSAPSTPEVAYRGALRWVRGYDSITLPPTGDSPSGQGGVYLITGGLGQIGLALAGCLASEFKAKLVLTSRTPLPERATWDDPAASWRSDARMSARIDALRELEAAGAEVMTAHADVIDEAAMRATVESAEERFGPIIGIVHAAGLVSGNGFQGLQGLDRDACNALFEPKLRGTRVLESVFAGRRLELCLLTSSLSTVLGGLGLGAYAAANACLDALAGQTDESPGLRWRCVNWDGWRGDEEEVSQGSLVARLAMSQSEGVETFRRIAAMRGVARVVVSTADLDSRLAQWVAVPDTGDVEAGDGDRQPEYERPELAEDYVEPRNEVEEGVATIWSQLLGIQRVGVHDDFLDLGGHSLLATQLIARIRSQMKVDVSLDDVFRGPTVSELAALIIERTDGSAAGDGIDAIRARVSQMSPEERQSLLEQARHSKEELS